MLPLALKLSGKDVLVIGAGRIGAGKAALLVDAGARVTMIARDVLAELPQGLDGAANSATTARATSRGYALVVSATGDADVNDRVVDEARRENIWLNVVDDPERSDFYFTAVHRAGDVTVSVSTEGASPALAQELRSMIAERLPDNLGRRRPAVARRTSRRSTPPARVPKASTGDREFANCSASNATLALRTASLMSVETRESSHV